MSKFNYSILSEHKRVIRARYLFAIIIFAAVLASTVVTWFFMGKKGVSPVVLYLFYGLMGVNALQMAFRIIDWVLRGKGNYSRVFMIITYIFGGLWLAVWAAIMIVGTLEISALRLDLLVIFAIQTIVAVISYLLWPSLDRKAVDAMTKFSVRNDEKLRKKKAKGFVRGYIFICMMLIVLQVATIFAYQIPPKVYDLFDNVRALQYKYIPEEDAYEVTGIYLGTSSQVIIPATYNNKKVIGLAANAINEDNLLGGGKITVIDIGTPKKREDGTDYHESNLRYIGENAIKVTGVEQLRIPNSVEEIADNAIVSSTLQSLRYEGKAAFSFSYLECQSLQRVIMTGDDVGKLKDLNGMERMSDVKIVVDKDIYNKYRKESIDYASNFRPDTGDGEICIDFYTNCDYYIDSIFASKSAGASLSYTDLINEDLRNQGLVGLDVDTRAYINNEHELGTAGAKANSAFRGWYTDEQFTAGNECKFKLTEKTVFTEDTAIYAKWVDEYDAAIDWGTYPQTDEDRAQIDRDWEDHVYWTADDVTAFPVVSNRRGYEKVEWNFDGTTRKVKNSKEGGNNDIGLTLHATWVLKTPTVIINTPSSSQIIDIEKATSNGIVTELSYTYEKNTDCVLSADITHELSEENNEISYSYLWRKEGDTTYTKRTESISLKNVGESGTYSLKIVGLAEYGREETETSTGITVEIKERTLDLTGARFDDSARTATYNTQSQTMKISDAFDRDSNYGTKITYSYYNYQDFVDCESSRDKLLATKQPIQVSDDASLIGVMNAGDYYVCAFFEKRDDEDIPNYQTAYRSERFTINPQQVTDIKWEPDEGEWTWPSSGAKSVLYDGKVHMPKATFNTDNRIAGLDFVYDTAQDDLIDKNVLAEGSYSRIIVGMNNPNYSCSAKLTATLNTIEWTITRRPIYLSGGWYVDGHKPDSSNGGGTSDSDRYMITYSGTEHVVSAQIKGYTATSGVVTYPDGSSDVVNLVYAANKTNRATAVLTYESQITGVDNGNYVFDDQGYFYWEIERVPLTIMFDDPSLSYTGGEIGVTATISGFMSGTDDVKNMALSNFDFSGKDNDISYYGRYDSGENKYYIDFKAKYAGTYKAVINKEWLNGDGIVQNYEIVEKAEKTFTINKRTLTCSFEESNKAYNGEYQTFTLKIGGFYSGDVSNIDASLFVIDEGASNGRASGNYYLFDYSAKDYKAGNYTATIAKLAEEMTAGTFADAAFFYNNYKVPTEGLSASYGIAKKNLTISKWNVYETGTTEPLPSVSFVAGKTAGENTVTYRRKGYYVRPVIEGLQNGENIELDYTGDNDVLTADNYQTVATFSASTYTNYSLATTSSVNWSISQYTLTVEWNGENSYTYDGTEKTQSVNYVDAPFAGDAVELKYNTGAKATDVGNYTASVSLGTAGQSGNYQILENNTFSWTIQKKSVSVIWSDNVEFTYNGQYQGPSFQINGITDRTSETISCTVRYYVGDNKISANQKVISTQKGGEYFMNSSNGYAVNVGNYTVKVELINNNHDNYVLSADAGKTFNIVPKMLTLSDWKYSSAKTSATGTYDPKALVYNTGVFTVFKDVSGMVDYLSGGEDVIGLVYDHANYTYAGTNYSTTITGLSGTHAANYVLPATGTTLDWQINKKVLDLSWDDSEKVYDPSSFHYETAGLTTGASSDTDGKIYGDDYTKVTLGYNEEHAQRDAGSYTASVTELLDNGTVGIAQNYIINQTTNNHEWTIKKKPVELTWTYAKTTYDKTAQYPTASFTYHGVTTNVSTYVNNDESSVLNNINAGDYTIKATAIDNDNFTLTGGTDLTKSYTIQTLQIVLDWYWDGTSEKVSDFTYNGKTHIAVASVRNIKDGDVINLTYETSAAQKAGNYTAKVTAVSNANYRLNDTEGNNKVSFSVNKKVVSFAWGTSSEVTDNGNGHYTAEYYKGREHTLTATVNNYCSNDSNIDDTVTVEGYTLVRTSDYGHANADIHGVERAGTYSIRATTLNTEAQANYEISGNNTVYLTINKQAVTIGTWENSASLFYDGSMHNRTTTVVGSNDGADVSFKYTISTNGGSFVEGNSAKDAATYTIKVEVDSLNTTDYYIADSAANQTATMQIKQVVVTVAWSGNTFNYNGDNQSVYAIIGGGVNGETPTATTYSGTRVSGIGNMSDGTTVIDVGEYTTQVVTLSSNNYALPTDGTNACTITVNPIVLNVSSWSGNANVTYKGAAYTDRVPNISTQTNIYSRDRNYVSFNYTYKKSGTVVNEMKTVGSYTIEITGIGGTRSANYVLAGGTGLSATMVIEKKELTLSWNGNESYTYDGNVHSRTLSMSGISSGDVVNATVTLDNVNISGLTMPKDVGNHTFRVTAIDNENYKLPETLNREATMAINQVTATISWSGSASLTYDGGTHTLTPTITNRKGNDVVNLSYTIGGVDSASADLPKNAGTYNYVLTNIDNGNYSMPSSSTTLTINKKTVTISWSNNSFEYDGTTKTLSATVGGTIAADGTVTVTGYDGTTTRQDVGSATATVSGLSNSNYAIPTNGTQTRTLTITQRPVTILSWSATAFTYDRTAKTVTATVGNIVYGDSYTITYGGTTSATNAGDYTATVSSINNSNYSIPANSHSWTINKKVVGITWDESTYTYNGTVRSNSATIGNVVSGDSITFNYSGETSGTYAGTYTATITGLSGTDSANYQLPATGLVNTLTIKKLNITGHVWSDMRTAVEYDGANKNRTLNFAGSNILASDNTSTNLTVAYSYKKGTETIASADDIVNKGTYTITATLTGARKDNYSFNGSDFITFELTITPKTVTLDWGTTTYDYDGTQKTITATLSGVVYGETVFVTDYSGVRTGTDAGAYTVTATALSSANYALPTDGTQTAQLVINKRALSVSWSIPSTNAYTGSNIYAAPTLNGLIPTDSANVTASCTLNGSTSLIAVNPGSYTVEAVSISGTATNNYSFSSNSHTFTITSTQNIAWNHSNGYRMAYTGSDLKNNITASLTDDYGCDVNVNIVFHKDTATGVVVTNVIDAGDYVAVVSITGADSAYFSVNNTTLSFIVFDEE